MGAAVVIAGNALGSVAHADEPLERCGLGGYVEPSALVGASTRITGPGERTTSRSALFEVGGGLSFRACSADRRAATRLQLGLHLSVGLDGTTGYNGVGGVGFEAAADHTIAPGRRLGGITSVSFGNEYMVYTLGARLHYRDWAWAGLELVRVQTEYGAREMHPEPHAVDRTIAERDALKYNQRAGHTVGINLVHKKF